jgi:hypothetical protein
MISERRKPLAVSFCTPDLKGDVLPFDVTDLPPLDGARSKLGIADLKEGYDATQEAFG